jgi:hypothetical protein
MEEPDKAWDAMKAAADGLRINSEKIEGAEYGRDEIGERTARVLSRSTTPLCGLRSVRSAHAWGGFGLARN